LRCIEDLHVLRILLAQSRAKNKEGSEASSLVPMVSLAQELVAPIGPELQACSNRSACSRPQRRWGQHLGSQTGSAQSGRAEGTHAGRLHSGWSGIHFESVECAAIPEERLCVQRCRLFCFGAALNGFEVNATSSHCADDRRACLLRGPDWLIQFVTPGAAPSALRREHALRFRTRLEFPVPIGNYS